MIEAFNGKFGDTFLSLFFHFEVVINVSFLFSLEMSLRLGFWPLDKFSDSLFLFFVLGTLLMSLSFFFFRSFIWHSFGKGEFFNFVIHPLRLLITQLISFRFWVKTSKKSIYITGQKGKIF
jgi:hypothetical protein